MDLFDVFVTVFTFNKHILCLTVQISSFAPCTDAIEDLYDLFSDIVLFHLCRSSIGVDFDVFLKGYAAACDSLDKYGMKHYADLLGKYYKLDKRSIEALPDVKFGNMSKPSKADLERVDKWLNSPN